jgi:hypothetical protein
MCVPGTTGLQTQTKKVHQTECFAEGAEKEAGLQGQAFQKVVLVKEHRLPTVQYIWRVEGFWGWANQCTEAKSKVPVSDIGLRPALAWVAH